MDPDIQLYGGPQYPNQKENFGIFLDSMPDTWGRTLMKRREALLARERNEKPKILYDIDFLLGVYDESRKGALRFKTDPNGDFLDNNKLHLPRRGHFKSLFTKLNKGFSQHLVNQVEKCRRKPFYLFQIYILKQQIKHCFFYIR